MVQSIEDRGDVKALIDSLEKEKRETLLKISEAKKRAKDIDASLSALLKAEAA